jgi:hypothetical protein
MTSGDYYLFTDGVLLDTWTNSNLPALGNKFTMFSNTGGYSGQVNRLMFDEFRFSNICRYTSDFTPQSSPYTLNTSWNSVLEGTDYIYGYNTGTNLQVKLLTAGDYKINYVG